MDETVEETEVFEAYSQGPPPPPAGTPGASQTPTQVFAAPQPSAPPQGYPQPNPNVVYVAPDGSVIQPRSAAPPSFPTQPPMGPPQAQQPLGTPGPTAGRQFTVGTTTVGPMNVGLLVWGAVLAVVGLLLVLTSAIGPGAFQALVVILFAAAGIAFLVLAYVLAQSQKPVANSSSSMQPPQGGPDEPQF